MGSADVPEPGLLVSREDREELERTAALCPSVHLNIRQRCDLELLLNGGFAPLRGYLHRGDYQSVLENMRLADGTLWPIPIVLDVSEQVAGAIDRHRRLVLKDSDGTPLAVMSVEDIWNADPELEAEHVFGTMDMTHPGVRYLCEKSGRICLGGAIAGLRLPRHDDFTEFRHAPGDLKHRFRGMGWNRVIAFQTRNPMHRAHMELTKRATEEIGGNLLIHPVVGPTKPGDIDPARRVRCYRHALKYYPPGLAVLSLLPLAMRMAGPREALWHALIRKNYGCTHFIVGRDHAGPGPDGDGRPFYEPYAAQDLLSAHEKECDIQIIPFREMVYVRNEGRYCPEDQVSEGNQVLRISGSRLREILEKGEEIPEWFTFPEVARELKKQFP